MEESVRTVLGPKWSLELLSLLAEEGSLNYSDIEGQFPTSSDIVTERLQTLNEAGLIDRTARSQRDVQYTITKDGKAVLQLVREIESYLES